VQLAEPQSGLQLCLVSHPADASTFDEFRAGLDHLEFLVEHRRDLDAWVSRLGRVFKV
jgi:catechol-2,3-dioxygenase